MLSRFGAGIGPGKGPDNWATAVMFWVSMGYHGMFWVVKVLSAKNS
jgi:hypothetical protein